MVSFRGDAHKIYLRLKKAATKDKNLKSVKELAEIEEIQRLYVSLNSSTLQKIYYRMVKEKNGSGIIPVFVSSVPWLLFLFSKQLQQFLFKEGSFLWVIFVFVYISVLIVSVLLHFREKSWAMVHTEIIQDILEDRKK
ncbi:hypothetical protein FZC66_05895 [Priestia megaterium]|nr:hypothetical protein FZC66_05895 [Priestia megaterium]